MYRLISGALFLVGWVVWVGYHPKTPWPLIFPVMVVYMAIIWLPLDWLKRSR